MTCGICLALAAAGARADDQAEVKALLDKVIKAHGGEDKLSKQTASVAKIKGKFYGMGEGQDYTLEVSNDGNKRRFELDFSIDGTKFKMVQVVNGDKGWLRVQDATMKLEDDALAEAKEELYVHQVTSLAPLKDKAYKLSLLGESKVEKKAAVGLKVSHKDHRDVNLYFDKDTGLLLKVESTIKDVMAGGQEINQVHLVSDYKDVDGRKVAMKVVINRDGKLYVDGETTEFKYHDKLDDSVFGKP
jgi:hypothetical protein